jgi:hypothetical protein
MKVNVKKEIDNDGERDHNCYTFTIIPEDIDDLEFLRNWDQYIDDFYEKEDGILDYCLEFHVND